MSVVRYRSTVRVAGLVALLGAVPALGRPPAEVARPFQSAGKDDGATVVRVDRARVAAAARSDATVTMAGFPLGDGATVDLTLRRFSVTRPDTTFVVGRHGAEDVPVDFDADRITLLRGTVAGEPGSSVFLALSPWGSTGRIERNGGGERYAVAAGAADDTAITLRVRPDQAGRSLPPGIPLCGVVSADVMQQAPPPGGAPLITRQIELAVETDYELYSLFGDLDAAGAYLVELYAAVSDIYLRDVNTRVVLSFVRLWDDPADLFNAEDPLYDFRDYWELNEVGVHRDVAQFLSGRRNLPYGGVAWLSALCSEYGYSVVGYVFGFIPDPSASSVFGYDVKVAAHELGHNAGTLHTHNYGLDTCDDLLGAPQRGTIMSYCSQTRSGSNANSDPRFHAVCQDNMRQHIFFEATCLAKDCNGNGIADSDDIIGGSPDVNSNGILDECEDCDNDGTLDPDEIAGGSFDTNGNGIPDECDPDCNGNGVPDDRDILLGNDTDLYGNNIPDGCETDCDNNGTSDYTDIQTDMSLDIDRNAVLDSCQDCDGDDTNDLDALQGAHNAWVASSEPGAGLDEYHAFTGVRVGESVVGPLSDPQDLIITATGRILVSNAGTDEVLEYASDGSLVGVLVDSASGLDYPTGLVSAPDGNLLVASRDSNSVHEYNAATGAFVGVFISAGSGGLVAPFGLAFGPGGNLFVTSSDNRVIEYDGTTGAVVGDFVTASDNGTLTNPHGILFKPDGNLLVASRNSNEILEFDGTTGAFVGPGSWQHGGTAVALTLDEPWTIRLGRDGDVYASRHDVEVAPGLGGGLFGDDVAGLHVNSTRIYVYDIDNGNFLRSYVTGHDTGLSFPTGFDFMPGAATDCNFNGFPDPCDITAGTSLDNNSNGTPDECDVPGDADGDGLVNVTDLLILLAGWGPCPTPPSPCPGDFNGDGTVGVDDLLTLLGNWTT